MREALRDVARSVTAHIPGRPMLSSTEAASAASPAELGPLLAEALELSRTRAGSTPGDAVSGGLADLFAKAYLVLATRDRSESPKISAATAARLVNSVTETSGAEGLADHALPGPGQPVGFAADIKPLFRARDRQSMSFAFDLWSYDDVRSRAADIVRRLREGTMPCDGRWPAAQVEVFQRWLDTGLRP